MPEIETQSRRCCLLCVDDERLILSMLSSGLSRAGYEVHTAESVDEAEQWLNTHQPDLVILDVNMPRRNGLELAQGLHDIFDVPFMLMTAHSDPEIIEQANALGAIGYLVKPVDTKQLIPAIETGLARARERQALRKSRTELQTALDGDRAVSIAIGILMDHHRVNYDVALDMLRKKARSSRTKLLDLARSIINSREFLNKQ